MKSKKTSVNNDVLYKSCARILRQVEDRKTTIKTEVFKSSDPKTYCSLLNGVIRNIDFYDDLLKQLDVKCKDRWRSIIYVHEVLNNRMSVESELSNKIRDLGREYIPKKAIQQHFVKVNYTLVNSNERKIDMGKYLNMNGFFATFVPNLFYTLKEKRTLVKCSYFKKKFLSFQNLSSCLPPYLLKAEEGSIVIDACAAPGNKTTFLSELHSNNLDIFAFERKRVRYDLLKSTCKPYNRIICKKADFLDTEIDGPLADATYAMVDPSCSGSGIHDLYEYDEMRVQKLKAIQIKLLQKAMSFPKMRRIVYSTCSLHDSENEGVIFEALEGSNFQVKKIVRSELIKDDTTSYVQGIDVTEDGFVKCMKSEQLNGFFVALIENTSIELDQE